MKPRKYGSPYKQLKAARKELSRQQYLAMMGQIRHGRERDAMRGLDRLKQRAAEE